MDSVEEEGLVFTKFPRMDGQSDLFCEMDACIREEWNLWESYRNEKPCTTLEQISFCPIYVHSAGLPPDGRQGYASAINMMMDANRLMSPMARALHEKGPFKHVSLLRVSTLMWPSSFQQKTSHMFSGYGTKRLLLEELDRGDGVLVIALKDLAIEEASSDSSIQIKPLISKLNVQPNREVAHLALRVCNVELDMSFSF
ncbi:hypothetical protein DAPPUDRAFT_261362 [Daphnia pulex]|uniref:Uncharacterized protein n=1 Tax=Daphnia pulex TaxID=6669 RepID=E9HKW6_DAPPU|nr:hypothetical protein DAPPUDRAFT_261362 [Daphnia pulex]|eukprot:EFX67625.1 hypothetical protein DAPPUDRAFT_261362 [Daphnia pulex]